MPDALSAALHTDGLIWLILAALSAGLVRGFSGFGTAMIYLPVAAQVLSPLGALASLALMDVLGPVPAVRGAWRAADRADLARLLIAMALALPLGLAALHLLPQEIFRYAVSLGALALVALLISGLRFQTRPGPTASALTGALSGLLGGLAGLPGPPVILIYMASPRPAAMIRATILLFLWGFDLILLSLLALQGVLSAQLLLIGLGLSLPMLLGVWLGATLFQPGRETLYRRAAYGIIALSALRGLPLWG